MISSLNPDTHRRDRTNLQVFSPSSPAAAPPVHRRNPEHVGVTRVWGPGRPDSPAFPKSVYITYINNSDNQEGPSMLANETSIRAAGMGRQEPAYTAETFYGGLYPFPDRAIVTTRALSRIVPESDAPCDPGVRRTPTDAGQG